MQEKVKGMLRDMAMPKMKKSEAAPMEGMEEEEMEGEEEPEAEDLSSLVEVSDEALMAEAEKRGMKISPAPQGKEVASGGASVMPLPEVSPEEEEELPLTKKV